MVEDSYGIPLRGGWLARPAQPAITAGQNDIWHMQPSNNQIPNNFLDFFNREQQHTVTLTGTPTVNHFPVQGMPNPAPGYSPGNTPVVLDPTRLGNVRWM